MNDIPDPQTPEDVRKIAAGRRRLIGFGIHLVGYFVVMLIIVPLNFWMSPDDVWFLLPLVGWGAVLAVHVAYVMGLLELLRPD